MSELERDDIQGLLAWGYGHLTSSAWHVLRITDPVAAGEWLGRVAAVVTTAEGSSPKGQAVNVALTPSGLGILGLPAEEIDEFSLEFRGGMTTEHRQRLLGDTGDRSPANWSWGGPGGAPVDLLLLLYAADETTLMALEDSLLGTPDADGIETVQRLDTNWLGDHEHFGFHDGISQPVIDGMRDGRPEDTIAPGEFILGYDNEYGRPTEGPEFARNGSFLVVRQLGQDVPAFWRFADAASRENGGRSAGGPAKAREALAARIVGRWRSGAPVTLTPERDDPKLAGENDFLYHEHDAEGLGCPLGAHVRRANPRDSLDPDPGSDASIRINKRHRLLRRGRTYGPAIAVEDALTTTKGKSDERGLLFACLCGNLARQFEFVQHTWLNNPKFAGLYEDPDPLLGPDGGTLTIQAKPVRRRVNGLPEFVSVHGGAYFFLPGVHSLRRLASLTR